MTINLAQLSRLDHAQIGHARLVDTCLVTPAVMRSPDDRHRLATSTLAFARSLVRLT